MVFNITLDTDLIKDHIQAIIDDPDNEGHGGDSNDLIDLVYALDEFNMILVDCPAHAELAKIVRALKIVNQVFQ